MSRIVRGVAIIFMIFNHSLPGRVIGIAAALFSFLVGYGYAFAKQRNARNALKRIWHLLSGYWFIILVVCLPIAYFTYSKRLPAGDVALAMFGMNPCLSAFSWYVYFYIFAMILIPFISRVIDRTGWVGTLLICLLFGGIYWWLVGIPADQRIWGWHIAHRCSHYMPIVVAGYYIAKKNLVSYISVPDSVVTPIGAVAVAVGIYFLRGVPYAQIFDVVLVPAFAFCISAFFIYRMKWLRMIFTDFGVRSMHMWFLHALFFTTATRGFVWPWVSWIHEPVLFALAVLIISYFLAVATDTLHKYL